MRAAQAQILATAIIQALAAVTTFARVVSVVPVTLLEKDMFHHTTHTSYFMDRNPHQTRTAVAVMVGVIAVRACGSAVP